MESLRSTPSVPPFYGIFRSRIDDGLGGDIDGLGGIFVGEDC